MRFGILGTGVVGKTMVARLYGMGHEVMVGTRIPEETTSRAEPDAHGEMVAYAISVTVSLNVLELTGEITLNGEILVDVAHPLDLSQGMPSTLAVSNTDTLGEQIQSRYPEAKVVEILHQ